MSDIKKQFDDMLGQLNEDAGRGRGPQVWKGAKSSIDDFTRSINMDYLNRASPNITGKEVPYNFNNYYTLDIRIKPDKLAKVWESGREDYNAIFQKHYQEGNYDAKLKESLRLAYEALYDEERAKLIAKGKNPDEVKITPQHQTGVGSWSNSPLPDLLKHETINYVYEQMPAIGIFPYEGGEALAIKPEEFVPMIMNGMISAARGHVPQGVTIEEIMEGKFSRKVVAPEKGTFINKVKDPTSEQDFDFRAWDTATLKELHNLVMNTFKRDTSLKMTVPELRQTLALDATRSELFLYMSQDDFNKFEKGGEGFKNLAKSTLDYMQAKAPKLNI
jgi:hypothetical protein